MGTAPVKLEGSKSAKDFGAGLASTSWAFPAPCQGWARSWVMLLCSCHLCDCFFKLLW